MRIVMKTREGPFNNKMVEGASAYAVLWMCFFLASDLTALYCFNTSLMYFSTVLLTHYLFFFLPVGRATRTTRSTPRWTT